MVTANNIVFIIDQIQSKVKAKSFDKLKNPFLVHFPKFGGKKCFLKKSGPVTHNVIWVSSIMPKFRKNNNTIARKHLDRRTDERTDRLYDLLATAGGPIYF